MQGVHTPDEAQIQISNPSAPNSPVYIVADKAYEDASALTGGAQGVSFPEGMQPGDMMRALFSPVGRQALMDVLQGKDPAIVSKKYGFSPTMLHEMMHQTLGKAPNQLDPSAVRGLIPSEGYKNLTGAPGRDYMPLAATQQRGPYGYSSGEAQFEIPVRLATQPESVGMTPETAKPALARYRGFLEKSAPDKLAQFDQYMANLPKMPK
jgi:hypothetical protein